MDPCTGLLIVASHQLQEMIMLLLLGMLLNDDELINRISQATNYTSTVCYI